MKTINKLNFAQTVIILLCTVLVVMTNYMFTKSLESNIYNKIMQDEYNKIGGKDNYDILQEVQKKELQSYINKIKEEQPDFIYSIKQKNILEKNKQAKLIPWEDIQKFQTDKNISIIEFSDFECPYCIDFHNQGNLKSILEAHSGTLDYNFMNFPLPKHENGFTQALAVKCVEKYSDTQTYNSYINTLFKENKVYGVEELSALAESFEIKAEDFNSCISDQNNKQLVQNEFEQGRKFGVEMVPATVIINQNTGEYKIISGKIQSTEISQTIENFIQ